MTRLAEEDRMNKHEIKTEEELVDATHNIVSRHQDIPPTPRDTMAVIMQAAEREREKPAWKFPIVRWVSAAAAILLIVGIGYFQYAGGNDGALVVTTESSQLDDLGFDVVAWDMEIESLLDDLDESFAALSYDDYTTLDF